ncbi:aldo/keto reductase [Labedaea rhizosphaerae]|uniref:Aryl-alcohol dehydrogenase-like predicted oxidoreductase n=1 Tax=Labedaea rhizosphaerae TaxID=598644 RepID=A0A4R6SE49_LABRH|nr:aldo/keto reductase [Labedaea rhizosphaerae]TDP97395.1 aryl-alcohol dehydrogenase-like predicted oxidoreductase [Labedaea rhizosphaerae]
MTSETKTAPGGTFALGGDLTVNRLGYGAMRIVGKGVWGPPEDHDRVLAVLREAVARGVNFIDTADSYGPFYSEELIKEALHPYPEDLVIATKGGFVRTGPDEWTMLGKPAYLRQQVETSLRRLGVERIDLYQLHRVDPDYPLADQVGELKALRDEGKIRHIGLSEVDVETLEEARETVEIVSVQNMYNVASRASEAVLDHAEANGIGFIPWFPVGVGKLARPGGVLDDIAKETGATPAQLALAWLLRRSPVMLPIPGTSSPEHLAENMAAAEIELTDEQFEAIAKAAE